MDNVTVVEGREAVLSCSVTRLRDFKVGWIKVSKLLSWRSQVGRVYYGLPAFTFHQELKKSEFSEIGAFLKYVEL